MHRSPNPRYGRFKRKGTIMKILTDEEVLEEAKKLEDAVANLIHAWIIKKEKEDLEPIDIFTAINVALAINLGRSIGILADDHPNPQYFIDKTVEELVKQIEYAASLPDVPPTKEFLN